ncbi:hypothetical protein SEVIR_3G335701v4 [Setaria viridis]
MAAGGAADGLCTEDPGSPFRPIRLRGAHPPSPLSLCPLSLSSVSLSLSCCSLSLPSLPLYAFSEAAIPKRSSSQARLPRSTRRPRLHSPPAASPPRLEIRPGISWVATGCRTCYKKGLLFWGFPGALILDDVSVKGAGIVV